MKRFNKQEDNFIESNYLDLTLTEIANELNRSVSSVHGRLKVLGLKIPKEIILKRMNDGLKIGQSMVDTRFKKGSVPWNKGMKGLQIGGVETRFKEGHLPHNTRNDGDERLTKEGYIEIRVSKGVWKLKHRVVWEITNGEIPKGNIIKFKDGDRKNVNINNIYMGTRQEHMNANSIQRYPKELIKTIKNLSKLEKQLKK